MSWATLPALLICYQLAFSRTIGEYLRYRQQHTDVTIHDPVVADNRLQVKNKKLDVFFNRYVLDTLYHDRDLLKIVTTFCDTGSLQLKEYKPVSIGKTDSIPVLTRLVRVEGRFHSVLNLVHALETTFSAGRVSSVEYKRYKEISDKKYHLSCTLYVQNIAR